MTTVKETLFYELAILANNIKNSNDEKAMELLKIVEIMNKSFLLQTEKEITDTDLLKYLFTGYYVYNQ